MKEDVFLTLCLKVYAYPPKTLFLPSNKFNMDVHKTNKISKKKKDPKANKNGIRSS
jgi:hypothetical protein